MRTEVDLALADGLMSSPQVAGRETKRASRGKLPRSPARLPRSEAILSPGVKVCIESAERGDPANGDFEAAPPSPRPASVDKVRRILRGIILHDGHAPAPTPSRDPVLRG